MLPVLVKMMVIVLVLVLVLVLSLPCRCSTGRGPTSQRLAERKMFDDLTNL